MTENEAIKEIEASIDLAKMCTQNYERKNEIQGYEMAIKALEEVQQYRQIGKISTCKNAVEICKAMIERGIDPDNIAEYIKFEDNLVQRGYDLKKLIEMMEEHKQYCQIGTVEECRAAVEKQSAKKVISFDYNNGTVNYGCPVCKRKIISKIDGKWCGGTFNEYCDRCGQKLDWSDEE